MYRIDVTPILYRLNNTQPLPRVYCFILTTPDYFDTRARAVNLTWAPRCDKYHFISKFPNDTKGLPIAPIASIVPGYKNLLKKTNLAVLHAYKYYFNDFDWFMKADDDTYVFVDNLKSFLSRQNTSISVTFGYNFNYTPIQGFHSGGAGYVLSREALRRLHEAHHDPNIVCAKDQGPEDVEIAACLRKTGVIFGKSVDQYNRERFHPLPFTKHFLGPIPEILNTDSENKPATGNDC